MLTMTNFLTVAGAAGITVAVVTLIKKIWPRGPEPWITWGVAEGVVFLGGLSSSPFTIKQAVLFFISGMVVAATALGSQTGIQHVTGSRSRSA
jgi:hypothetical protein